MTKKFTRFSLFFATLVAVGFMALTSPSKVRADEEIQTFELTGCTDEPSINKGTYSSVSSIEIPVKPTKMTYNEGDRLIDFSGMQIKVNFDDGGSQTFVYGVDDDLVYNGSSYYIRVYYPNGVSTGNKTVEIHCDGKETSFDLTVFQGKEYTSGFWKYKTLVGGDIEITGYTGSDLNISVPAKIANKKVTAIGKSAFYEKNIQSITLPSTIYAIRDGAFNDCVKLKKAALKSGIKEIGYRTFENCMVLNDVSIPATVRYIGDYAFENTAISQCIIPEGVTNIDYMVFAKCSKLQSVTIPSTVSKISTDAFSGCTSLSKFNNKSEAFYVAGDGSLYEKTEYLTKNPYKLLFCNASISDLVVIDNAYEIGDYAFTTAPHIKSVSIPESLKKEYCVIKPGSPIQIDIKRYSSYKLIEVVQTTGMYKLSVANSNYAMRYDEEPQYIKAGSVIMSSFYQNDDTFPREYVETVAVTLNTANSGKCSDNISYKYDNGTVTLSGKGAITDYPEDFKYVKKIVIENGITKIPDWFCSSGDVESIVIPKSVKEIGYSNIFKKTVYGYTGTEAEQAAKNSGGKFIPLDKSSVAAPHVTYATNYTAGVYVEWSKVTGSTGYIVYRKSGNGSWSRIADVKNGNTCWVDGKAVSGTTYVYTVRAYKGSEMSDWVSTKTIKRVSDATMSSATNTTSGITIKWAKVNGATDYTIYRRTSNTGWTLYEFINKGTTTSFTDKAVKSGTTYDYTVVAYSGSVRSDWHNYKSCKRLSDPTVSSASNITAGVQVKWAKTAGATGYVVYRKTGTGSWSRLATIKSGSTTSYTDKSAKSGTNYSYTVRACNGSTMSDWHNYKTVKRLSNPAVTSASKTSNGINVRWSKVTGATGYVVYRKTANGSWSRIANIKSGSTTSYTDTKASKGVTYTYTVRAYNGSTMSSFNSTKSAKR